MYFPGKPSSLYDHTNPDWAPTLNLGHGKVKQSASTSDSNRHKRSLVRREKKKSMDAATTILQPQHASEEVNDDDAMSTDSDSGTATQTDLNSETVSAMQAELQRLITENRTLKDKLNQEQNRFDENFFKNDQEKVKYYTGLPDFLTLNVLYAFVEPYIAHNSSCVLTKFQTLVLALIKLRLNISHIDIAQKFGINKSSASRLFLNMLDVLYVRLKPLVYWPDREQLLETTPMCFKVHFGTKVSVIIDCFEVFLERPSNLHARQSTWSSYKHNNTVKYLIGISPQGVISFISRGWGGRVSDKHLTEQCGLLNHLNPGDIVLADRGFDIADSVAMMGAKLHIPAFTRGKHQLSGEDVEKTRRIANVRIHVERVIGCLRQKYTILQSTLPVDYMSKGDDSGVLLTTLDKMVSVCCGLTNLCQSVVPFQ